MNTPLTSSAREGLLAASKRHPVPFPRRALVGPPTILVALVGVGAALGAFEASGGGLHSISGALLFVVGVIGALAAFVVELFAVTRGIRMLLSNAAPSSATNVACLAAGILVLLAVLAWFGLGVLL